MKKTVCLMIVGLLATAASAGVSAEWQKSVDGSYDIYTLQVISNDTGLNLSGYDIKVTGSDFVYTSFSHFTGLEGLLGNEYSCILLDEDDLLEADGGSSDTTLYSAAAAKAGSDLGSLPTFLHIVVANDAISDPLTELAVSGTTGATPMVRPGSSASIQLDIVPEPTTMALLGLGGLALLRRRRK